MLGKNKCAYIQTHFLVWIVPGAHNTKEHKTIIIILYNHLLVQEPLKAPLGRLPYIEVGLHRQALSGHACANVLTYLANAQVGPRCKKKGPNIVQRATFLHNIMGS